MGMILSVFRGDTWHNIDKLAAVFKRFGFIMLVGYVGRVLLLLSTGCYK